MFICFEGIDGAGKTTQVDMLRKKLCASGYSTETVADPGTTKIGTAIRSILLDSDDPISPSAQMLLFSAARAELVDYIKKRIASDTVVICDRWFLSTLVYQGVLNNVPIPLIQNIFENTGFLVPDLCFILDISPEEALVRMAAPSDRYERSCMDDRKLMRLAYLEYGATLMYDADVKVVSANGTPASTHEAICSVVFDKLVFRST